MSPRPDTKPYTVASTAPKSAIDAAHRGVLLALRGGLDMLCVSVEVDDSWPTDVTWAVEALQPRRVQRRTVLTHRHKPATVVADLRPADDQDFAIALALVPYTSYTIGITQEDGVTYGSYDCGDEPHFELTQAEHAVAASYMAAHGADPALLIQDQA
jgi:hypothetical protein